MAGEFWRAMSTQHWPDEVRRLAAGPLARDRQLQIPFAEGETLVETPGFDAMEAHRDAWRDLARRSIEPNPFLDADFALAAALHLPFGQRPDFVAIWQRAGAEPRARLIGLVALEQKTSGVVLGVGANWRYRHAALGTPLIDRFAATRAIDALLKWLTARRPNQIGFSIQSLVRDGPFARLLLQRCEANGLSVQTLAEHERAVLRPGQASDDLLSRAMSTKHRRELDRRMRRLQDEGAVGVHTATSPTDVRAATELYLALEQRGWKGQRGSAFLADVGDAAFLRSVLRLLARSGKCRIDWLEHAGAPRAMAILLRAGDRSYFWKTTYDEDYARFSPGAQLARLLIERQGADPSIVLTDSCAIADHPMIDRIWPDRQTIVDLLVGINPAQARLLPLVAGRERLRRTLREVAKSAAQKALGRRVS